MHFFVRSLNSQGEKAREMMEAKNYNHLLDKLEQQNIIPLDITQIPLFLTPFAFLGRRKKISQEEVIELLENIHLVIRSGLPLHQGLLDLSEDSDNKSFKDMLFHIANDIRMGKSLSQALEIYSDVIGVVVLNFVRIGEETGQLQSTLQRGASFLNHIVTLKKKAKSALIYPLFAFLAVTGAMLVWLIYVLPQMIELFKEMDVELPSITLFIMHISNFLSSYIIYLLLGIAAFIIMFKIIHNRYKRVRWYTDYFILKIPIIKEVIIGFNIAFITEYIRLAFISGVPLVGTLETLQDNIGNEIFRDALIHASEEIKKGNQLSSAFAKSRLFSPFMLRMMSVGEASGTLESQLAIISDYYYKKVDYYAENIGKFIEPVILILVGGFMALIMVGLMGPMYDLIGNLE